MSSVLRLVPMLLLAAACSRESLSELKDGETPPRTALVAVLGGNTSCAPHPQSGNRSPYGMDLFAPAADLITSLGQAGYATVDYFISCHNSDSAVRYATSAEPFNVRAVPWTEAAGLIATMALAVPETDLIIAGHSYGGWLAMKVAEALDDSIRVVGLFTIDPISRQTCSFTRPGGCTEAPSDFTATSRRRIRERSGNWVNFWQERTWYLHSGPMEHAHRNLEVDSTHTGIDTDAVTWGTIQDVVVSGDSQPELLVRNEL